jgi:hypothetical protein
MGWAVHHLGGSTKCRVGLIFAPALSGAWLSAPGCEAHDQTDLSCPYRRTLEHGREAGKSVNPSKLRIVRSKMGLPLRIFSPSP